MKVSRHSDLRLPESLRRKLISFRRRLWTVKLLEAVAATIIAILAGFLLTYLLDRLHDTSSLVRTGILVIVAFSSLAIPLAIHRWVIRRRRLDQLARLLAETRPGTGDQLLGVIELADDTFNWEQSDRSRSPELVTAAIDQVADHVANEELNSAIPNPKGRQRGMIAAALGLLAVALLTINTQAAQNAWARFVTPWNETPRYTFADLQPLPASLVVAQDEPFEVSVQLTDSSRWHPTTAAAGLSGQTQFQASLEQQQYKFNLPGQLSSETLSVKVGDFRGEMKIEPKSRPELSSLVAVIELPEYLRRTGSLQKEVRGSTISVVKGSKLTLSATASRPLKDAFVNGARRATARDQFALESVIVNEPKSIKMEWRDIHGLAAKQPFELSIQPVDDDPPSIACENFPRRKVLLDSEVIAFEVRASDDFGVKRVGIEWRAIDKENSNPESGEFIIGAGDSEAESLELAATFCAANENIQSRAIAVRVFAEDYLPGRERAYSPESLFDVLSADQHAIWITSQLVRWQKSSLDLKDRELQLYQTNKELRAMSTDELQRIENQNRLARQAQLERSGARQLHSLARNGEELLKEAMRNPEIGVGHLDRWAEMVKTLKEIADSRMPSVSELLAKAAKSSAAAAKANNKRSVGLNRLTQQGAGDPKKPSKDKDSSSKVPSISDIESSQNDLTSDKSGEPSQTKPSQSRLTLPNTMLASPSKPKKKQETLSAERAIEQAVKEQQDLLAEFDKISDELNEVLANLEGSTIVKRLKAASRRQQQIASRLAALASESFGVSDRKKESNADAFGKLAVLEIDSSERTSYIMDDMDAYFGRTRMTGFGRVLDQMRQSDVTAELRLLGDELRKENGLSISQAEYWSDTLDRWAEDLVGICESGECPGGKAKGSLPPSVVLEVLKLLEAEVNLREQTRVAEQARPALSHTKHIEAADRLWNTQNELQQRTDIVVERIRQLLDAESDFANEISMLGRVSETMKETVEILRRPDTGRNAIAAETEIIEMLLESKRFSPGGGGGAAAPGGGGKGETETPALALVGAGLNAKEFREEMSATPSTGVGGAEFPDEYRNGLDVYFNRLEAWRSGK